MQAMEDIDRPFVCGCGGELASEGAAIDGDDKGERFAIVWVTAQGLRELNDVCGSEVEVCAGDRRFLAKRRTRASASLCAVLRTSSEVSVPQATIVTSRCSGELST
jgi:hypothetical protein